MSTAKFDNDLYDSLLSIGEGEMSFATKFLLLEREGGKLRVNPYTDYASAKSMADANLKEFTALLKRAAAGTAKVLTDIKSEKSWISKTEGRGAGSKPPERIKDVLRGSIIAKNDQELEEVVKRLSKYAIINNIDEKTMPKDQMGYYGPWHIDIEVGKGTPSHQIAEVIVMTTRAYAAKKVSHTIYSGTRDEGSVTPEKKAEMAKQSQGLWKWANRNQTRRDRSDLRGKQQRMLDRQARGLR